MLALLVLRVRLDPLVRRGLHLPFPVRPAPPDPLVQLVPLGLPDLPVPLVILEQLVLPVLLAIPALQVLQALPDLLVMMALLGLLDQPEILALLARLDLQVPQEALVWPAQLDLPDLRDRMEQSDLPALRGLLVRLVRHLPSPDLLVLLVQLAPLALVLLTWAPWRMLQAFRVIQARIPVISVMPMSL